MGKGDGSFYPFIVSNLIILFFIEMGRKNRPPYPPSPTHLDFFQEMIDNKEDF